MTIRTSYRLPRILGFLQKKVNTAIQALKKRAIKLALFLFRSQKTVFLVFSVFLVALIFSFLVATLLAGSDYKLNGNYTRTVSTTGSITVQGLEIYGGDVKYDPQYETVIVDWGELALGAYKNASFYVRSNSNVDVELNMNVTNFAPPGIEDYITISWNYNGTLLNPTQEIPITVNLEIASSIEFIDFLIENEVMTFGFDMTIYASSV